MPRFSFLFLLILLPFFAEASGLSLGDSLRERNSFRMYNDAAVQQREFRAVWIATVHNIDWPRSGDYDIESQKASFIRILEAYEALNFNTVIVQVRAASDALYPSSYEPWSRVLTGEEGRAPAEGFDPLAFMIAESHKRGMDFHAWINPFRATLSLETAALAESHPYRQHHDWMVRYFDKYYFNPGIPEVRDYVRDIVAEIVEGYDIDGLHLDDYFYPYPEDGHHFYDRSTYLQYGTAFPEREDWRRANVDSLIHSLSDTIRSLKPWVQFGVSPFGVWRNQSVDPRGSETTADRSTYDDLYADPLTWMREGWVDYLIPQLYWSRDFHLAPYTKLIDWWGLQRSTARIYAGQGLYKVRNNHDKAWYDPAEVPGQIRIYRNSPAFEGTAFFSASSLMGKNQNLYKALQTWYFTEPALPPQSLRHPGRREESPEIRIIERMEEGVTVKITVPNPEEYRYVLTHFSEEVYPYPVVGMEEKRVFDDDVMYFRLPAKAAERPWFSLSLIDKYGRQSFLSRSIRVVE